MSSVLDVLQEESLLPSKNILKKYAYLNYGMQMLPCRKPPLRSDLQKPVIEQESWEIKSEGFLKTATLRYPWQALHVVASFGNYELLRMFIDHPKCDPFIEDFERNNALHYAMNIRQFATLPKHILDFESCRQFWFDKKRTKSLEDAPIEDKKDVEKSQIVEREGCINLLLQDGCDIFKYDKNKKVPDPQGNLIKNAEFCSWWYNKQEKEFAAIQNKLNIASNAISVTAALVATTSYKGPLQPPLGYDSVNQVQFENTWVAIFVFCDTSSFYLAIVAIILALIPALPM